MKNLVVILASVALLCSCSEDKSDENGGNGGKDVQITLSTDAVEFLATGDAVSGNPVTVTSSGDWRIAGDKKWCKPSSVAGKSGDEITFIADENSDYQPRSVVFTLFIGNKVKELTINQQAKNTVDIIQGEFSIPDTGAADIRIPYESASMLTGVVDEAGKGWITLPAQGSSRSTVSSYLHLKVAANETYGPRSGKVNLSGEGVEPYTITVNQKQNDVLRLPKTSYLQPLEASTIRMTIWSNVPYSVTIPDNAKSWLTLVSQPTPPTGWSSQELVFNLAAADAYRFASVVIASSDGKFSTPVMMQQGEPLPLSIPDVNFRQYLIDQKYIELQGENYSMTPAGLAATAMDLSKLWGEKAIKSLVGIENFTKLTTLNCASQALRELDLSKNPLITNNTWTKNRPNAYEKLSVGIGITAILLGTEYSWDDTGTMYDYTTKSGSSWPYNYYWSQSFVVSGANVTTIDVNLNKLKTLDVSGCPKLTTLNCKQYGATLTTITMSQAQQGKVTVTKDDNTTIVYK